MRSRMRQNFAAVLIGVLSAGISIAHNGCDGSPEPSLLLNTVPPSPPIENLSAAQNSYTQLGSDVNIRL